METAAAESFWLDLASPRIYSLLVNLIAWPARSLSLADLERLGAVFSKVIDYRSRFTATHSAGVAATAEALAAALNFEKRERALMRVAGNLHDLGKVSIPNAILEKPGKLDTDEMLLMKGHTYYTLQILGSIAGFEDVRYWAAFHHERMDGRGYPFRLGSDDLPLGSRIMAVADVFTAIAEDRPYRPSMPKARCLDVLNDMAASHALDGDIVNTLAREFDSINEMRRQVQAEHFVDYEHCIGGDCAGAAARN
jgi:HD-GYP domain-containing protein (c-di-GMP phosphodiesterase class II)